MSNDKKQQFTNTDIASMLKEMALFYDVLGERFKPKALMRGAETIGTLIQDVSTLYKEEGEKGLIALDGIGKGITEHIEQWVTVGVCEEYERLKKEVPVDVSGLMRIEGVGPKTIKTLYKELDIKTIDDLEKAIEDHDLQKLEGFGKKTEENIAQGIAFVREVGGRKLYAEIEAEAFFLKEELASRAGVDKVEIVGSFRRKKETVGDLDFLVVSENKNVSVASEKVEVEVLKTSKELWGSSLIWYTGSGKHREVLAEIAKAKGLEFLEIKGETEEEVYAKLGMSMISPELRENRGEIEASQDGKIPPLIVLEDMKGDLQMHTEWSDGVNTIEERARYAYDLGYEYIAITDHTQSLRMTGGLDEIGLRKQMKEIDDVNQKMKEEGIDFRVLKGAEVNIMNDGSLDVDDEVLRELDIVGAAVHSYFDLPQEEQTKRLLKVIEHPSVNIINHPTSRLINKRKGIDLDMERVFEHARKYNVALEIDAQPSRLDLNDILVLGCIRAGVKLVISSDAHSNEGLEVMSYGISQARRGWVTKENVINTRSVDDMLTLLKK